MVAACGYGIDQIARLVANMARVKDWGSKKDANHGLIKKWFEKMGCLVKDVSSVPGFVDLIVKKGSQIRLVEIKDPDQVPSKRNLTEAEQEFWEYWEEPPLIVETIDDVIAVSTEMRNMVGGHDVG